MDSLNLLHCILGVLLIYIYESPCCLSCFLACFFPFACLLLCLLVHLDSSCFICLFAPSVRWKHSGNLFAHFLFSCRDKFLQCLANLHIVIDISLFVLSLPYLKVFLQFDCLLSSFLICLPYKKAKMHTGKLQVFVLTRKEAECKLANN